MKMNYEITINRIIDYKKLADILGILLIMTLLYSFARQNAIYYQAMSALAKEQRQFGNIQEETDRTARVNMDDGLLQKAVRENKQIFLYPEFSLMNLDPVITSLGPAITTEKSATDSPKPIIDSSKPEIISPDQTVIADNPTIVPPNPPVPRIDTVIITPNSPAITEDSAIDSQEPPAITDNSVINPPKPPAITDDSAIDPANPPTNSDDSAINPANPPAIIDDSAIDPAKPSAITDDSAINPPIPPAITDDSVVNPPNPPAITDKPAIDSPNPPTVTEDSDNNSSIPDTGIDEISPKEDIDNTTSLCNGFLCNSSGIIIGCQDIIVIDGVISFPSSDICTGIAANALTSLDAQVYEIYIPANIITIEEGAFNGLTELFYIEVHPDNPVYASNEGCLYEK